MSIFYKMRSSAQKSEVEKAECAHVPRHVAIIMDGNGRWAKSRGLPRIMGHRQGAQRVREIFQYAAESGVEYLTLYAFSSENWNRPESEVSSLMKLLLSSLKRYGKDFVAKKIRFHTIGDVAKLPKECRDSLDELREKTKNFTEANLVLALNYGSRDELVRATNKLIESKVKNVQWRDIANALDTSAIPDPDFLIRTSGEMRLSNYLMLQAAYAELYFTEVFWPDFDKNQFQKALDEYAKRERRYGLTTEQLKK